MLHKKIYQNVGLHIQAYQNVRLKMFNSHEGVLKHWLEDAHLCMTEVDTHLHAIPP